MNNMDGTGFTLARITNAILFSLFVAALAISAAGLFFGFTFDDSFIYYRYIDNFAAGQGLVYNIGERHEGYSSFIWLLIVGSVKILTGINSIALAKVLGIGFFSLALVCLTAAVAAEADRHNGHYEFGVLAGAVLVLFVFLIPSATLWALGGLENGLWSLVLMAYVICVARGWTFPSCVAMCVLSITRVEGIAFAALPIALGVVESFWARREEGGFGPALKSHFVYERQKFYVAFYGSLLVFVGAMTLFRLSYFDQLLPATFHLKKPAGLFTSIAKGWIYLKFFVVSNPAFATAFAIAVVGGIWIKSRLFFAALLVVTAQFLFVLWVGGDWMAHARFLSAFIPLMALTIGIAWLWALSLSRSFGIVATVALLGLLCATLPTTVPAYIHAAKFKGHGLSLELNKKIGLLLNGTTTKDGVIAVGDAGVIPYYAQRSIIDLHGLMDKHLLHYIGDFTNNVHADIDADYVFSKKPAWVILIGNSSYLIDNPTKPAYPLYGILRDHPSFNLNYQFHAEFALTDWYVYQLFYDKRQVGLYRIDVDLQVDGDGGSKAEFYVNGDSLRPTVRQFENRVRATVSLETPHQRISQIRFDPTGTSDGFLTVYGLTLRSGEKVLRVSPKRISQLPKYHLELDRLTETSVRFRITGADPMLYFDTLLEELNEGHRAGRGMLQSPRTIECATAGGQGRACRRTASPELETTKARFAERLRTSAVTDTD